MKECFGQYSVAFFVDLWLINRRKKQLREMTMVSRSREMSSAPNSESSSDSSDSNSSAASMSSSQLRKIPKLLLLNVNRPAMYSLNGYVPKPSLHRVATPSTFTNRRGLAPAESNKASHPRILFYFWLGSKVPKLFWNSHFTEHNYSNELNNARNPKGEND